MTKVVSAEWTDELAKVELLRLLKRESDVCSVRMGRNNVIIFEISIITLSRPKRLKPERINGPSVSARNAAYYLNLTKPPRYTAGIRPPEVQVKERENIPKERQQYSKRTAA